MRYRLSLNNFFTIFSLITSLSAASWASNPLEAEQDQGTLYKVHLINATGDVLGEEVGTVRLKSASTQLTVSNFCLNSDSSHAQTLKSYIPITYPDIVPEMTELSRYALNGFDNKKVALDFAAPDYISREKMTDANDTWETQHHLYNSKLVKGSTNPIYTISIYHDNLNQKTAPQPILSYLLIRQ